MSEHVWHEARLAVGLDLPQPLGTSSARIASFLVELSCKVRFNTPAYLVVVSFHWHSVRDAVRLVLGQSSVILA